MGWVIMSERELNRNFWADDAFPKKYAGYFGMAAHQITQRRRSTQRKLIRYPELCQRVVNHLKDGWTPEQIEPPLTCRRAFVSNVRLLFHGCSRFDRTSPLLLAA
jgi:IS30 family transposase